MTENSLAVPLKIVGSGKREVEDGKKFGFKSGDGVWKQRKGKVGVLSNVTQSKEDRIEAEKVAEQLSGFKKYWLSVFRTPEEGEFQPSRKMVRGMFERAQKLENDLSEILIRNPEAFKAWQDKVFGRGGRKKAAMEVRVLGKDKANAVWERAIEQIDGKRMRSEYYYGNKEKEGGSWVLDGLNRLDEIVNTERVDLSFFANSGGGYTENYNGFKEFARSKEKGWGKAKATEAV